jgi:hypothetical protein
LFSLNVAACGGPCHVCCGLRGAFAARVIAVTLQDTPDTNIREMALQGANVWRVNGCIDAHGPNTHPSLGALFFRDRFQESSEIKGSICDRTLC